MFLEDHMGQPLCFAIQRSLWESVFIFLSPLLRSIEEITSSFAFIICVFEEVYAE